MKNTAMHKCYYLVQPTDMQEKLNMERFCKFRKVKVTVPSHPPPPAYYTRVFLVQGGYTIQGPEPHALPSKLSTPPTMH